MNLKRTFGTILILSLSGFSAALAHQPPKDLHLVGDHWTAWNPPTVFSEGAQIHTVRPGDTLWDLAQQYYGNSYLWPQIWEQNQYVLDAHWIYPGDPLVVGFEVTPIEEIQGASKGEGGGEGEDGSGEEDRLRLARGGSAPEPLGGESDLQCSGFIGDIEEGFQRQIIGSEYQSLAPTLVPAKRANITGDYGDIASVKIELSLGDVIYLDGGRAADLLPGDLYSVVIPRELVTHPLTGKTMGRFYSRVGRVRVLSAQQETAIAEIVYACLPVNVGAGLVPYEARPIPLARRTPQVGINDPVESEMLTSAPVVVRSEANIVTIGRGHLVYLAADEQDLTPGDIFSIYRLNRRGLPPVVIGELGVLSVEGKSAVAKVLESRYAIHVGDRVIPKR